MERDITQKLLEWKNSDNRKPLIVRGARQVGKSWTITSFGKEYFEGTIHVINMEKRPDLHQVFEKNYDIARIINELEILLNIQIQSGKDILFLDEIQECPKAIVSLRYFYEQMPELHVVGAGSLLEFAVKDIPFPVGRVHLMNMYPMTFREFLKARNKDRLVSLISDKPVSLQESIHNLLNEELKNYFFVGGMPECVKSFTESNKWHDVSEIQNDLLATYRQDFSKYAGRSDKYCLNAVWMNTAQQTGNQIMYSRLAEGYSNPAIRNAFELLETARLIRKVRAASPSGIPLGASASEKKFKALNLDIGLLVQLLGLNISLEYPKTDLLSIFRGMLAEQFVGQELLAATDSELYYWSREERSSQAETDYLIVYNGKIIPVEVKSGSKGRLRSLHLLHETFPNIDESIVFSSAAFIPQDDEKMRFLPLYYAGTLFRH